MLKFLFRLILIAVLVGAAWLAYGLLLPAGPTQQQLVQLKPGSSANHIAADLKNAGIIHSKYAFLLWHFLHGRKALKAGEYAFDHRASAREVYNRIARGDIFFHTVVVPEGYNMFDIANAVEQAGLGTRNDFLKIVRAETALVHDLDPQAPSLEGYLFPDTYHFTRTQSLHDMAVAMVRRFRQNAKEIGLDQNIHNVVTMASIVEKETGAPEERPEVASVFYNRMQKHMVLATDPSVIYAALLNGRYTGVIHQSDLHFDSPYNTYRVAGLPPGPISNPGKASLQAAMHPAQTDYLFFVSDNQGHHRFARTDTEHVANVQAYRRAVAQAANR
ncbi:MAG TPA: endolytic transglycosylase MltG [Candidatus Angelobacter sp.]|nr:endolytic transglycosylase MltG [Candidatus Angelobacter sp.]